MSVLDLDPQDLERAAAAIAGADAIVVSAGAGMGVDSGLPDFRGDQGFWRAYPVLKHLGISFVDMANPRWFREHPHMAWGFYGHRRALYRATKPHRGFELLKSWGETTLNGCGVFTSNVDGQFQKAGFDQERIYECHGAIEFEQCMADCGAGVYPAAPGDLEIDFETLQAKDPLPTCPKCGGLSRPNVMMFGDWRYDPARDRQQDKALQTWLEPVERSKRVVIECGAGTAIPSVRHFSEDQADGGAQLIRINPREAQAPARAVAFACSALVALKAIAERLD